MEALRSSRPWRLWGLLLVFLGSPNNNFLSMKILFTGGGTLGSVSPLLAIAEQLKKNDARCEFLWIGTENGPERTLVESYNILFKSIPCGKFRRYFSFKNINDAGRVFLGCLA